MNDASEPGAGKPHALQLRDWVPLLCSSTGVAFMILAAKGLGFCEKLGLAYFLGSAGDVEAYFAATSLTLLLFTLVEGIAAPIFLSQYVRVFLRDGQDSARAYARTILSVCGIALAALVIAAEIFPGPLLGFVVPGFDAARMTRAESLLRIMLPGGFLLGMSSLTAMILNAHRSFVWPAFSSVVYKAIIAFGFLLALPLWGIRGAAVSTLLGALALMTLHLLGIRWRTAASPGHTGLSPATVPARSAGPGHTGLLPATVPAPAAAPSHPGLPPATAMAGDRRTLGLVLPLAVGTLASQLALMADQAFASTLPRGSLASLHYARRLVDLPLLLIPGVLGTVAFPAMAALAAGGRPDRLIRFAARLAEFCLIVFLPLTILLAVASRDLVALVFERGAFVSSDVTRTASVLMVLALGFVAYAIEAVVLKVYYATLDTRTPVGIGLVFVLFHVLVMALLTPVLGLVAIPLAISSQKILKVLTLVAVLRRRYPESRPWFEKGRLVRIAACAAAFGFLCTVIGTLLPESSGTGAFARGFRLTMMALPAGAVYLLFLRATRILPAGPLRNLWQAVREHLQLER